MGILLCLGGDMPHGLRIQSASGYTQIDENYSNYLLYASGSANSPSGIPDYGSDQITLIRIPYGGVWGYDQGNSTVEWRAYRLSQFVGATGSYGLRVYGGNGALHFDSNRQAMKVNSITEYDNLALILGSGFNIYSGLSERPWIAIGFEGPIAFETADGGVGNMSYAIGPVARQNWDNSITIFPDSIGGGPPVIFLFVGDGPRYYLLGS